MRTLIFLLCLLYYCRYDNQAELQKKDLSYFVRHLSSDSFGGRESGTNDAIKTANFLASTYQAYHLYPPFEGRKYQQTFSLRKLATAGKMTSLRWKPIGALPSHTDKYLTGKKLLPFPFAKGGRVQAKAVFMGYCIRSKKRNDFLKVNLRGKIAICLRYGPGGPKNQMYRRHMPFIVKYRRIKEAGAAGVIFLGEQNKTKPKLKAFIPSLEEGPLAVFTDANLFNHTHLSNQNIGKILGNATLQTSFHYKNLKGQNVAAFLKPYHKGQKIIVLGAHYDHIGKERFNIQRQAEKIYNGADDNASGTAAVLELARFFKGKEEKTSNWIRNSRNILFINFDGEEYGLLGSWEFVRSSSFPIEDMITMINLDMIGRLRPKKGLNIQGAMTANQVWKELIQSCFHKAGFPSHTKLNLISGGIGPSDHTPFYKKKIPIAFFNTGIHSQYHKPEDDFELIRIEGLYQITYMVQLLVQEVLNPDQPLRFRPSLAKKNPAL